MHTRSHSGLVPHPYLNMSQSLSNCCWNEAMSFGSLSTVTFSLLAVTACRVLEVQQHCVRHRVGK